MGHGRAHSRSSSPSQSRTMQVAISTTPRTASQRGRGHGVARGSNMGSKWIRARLARARLAGAVRCAKAVMRKAR